ncbi:MAG: hypothetical protein MJ233_03385 [Mycoplasmoidaceae bacterium]|nr:hypothetical protein [Mycoplasmoidaceae bacterium]
MNITIDQPVKYTFSTEAYQYINLIDSVELYGDAESILDLPISTSITLDQDHMFQLTLIPKASIPGKAGDLPLGFKFNYKHDQQTITARFDSNYNFFYVDFGTVLNNNFAFASYNQVITKAMGITLPKPYKVSKINHIDLVSDTAETAITLVNADNIEVDENGYFLLKFKN